jgi:hypothetical protein
VIRTSHFREPREVWTREVTGYRWAYIVARLAALWEDISTPHWRDEIGIQWAVRDVESTQPQE